MRPYRSDMMGLAHRWSPGWRSTFTCSHVDPHSASGQMGTFCHDSHCPRTNLVWRLHKHLRIGLDGIYDFAGAKNGHTSADVFHVQLGLVYPLFDRWPRSHRGYRPCHFETQLNRSFIMLPLRITHSLAVWHARLAFVWAPLTALLMGAGLSVALGQTNSAVGNIASAERESQIKAKLTAAQEDFNRAAVTATNLPPGATAAEFIEYRSALQQLVRSYRFQLDDLAAVEATRARARDLERTMHLWSGFTEPPPYSILMVDELRNATHSSATKIKTAEVALKVDEKFLADAQVAMMERDERIRRIDEQIELANDPAKTARLEWLGKLERAHYRGEAASTASYAIRIKLDREELSENRQRLTFLQRQVALASQHVRFPQADLDKVLEGLDDERMQLKDEIGSADQDLAACQQTLTRSRETLGLLLQDASEGTTNSARVRNLIDAVEQQSLQAETVAQRLTVLREMLANLGAARQMWQLRFTVFNNPNLLDLQNAAQRLARLNALIEAAMPYYQQQLSLAASQIAEERTRLQGQAEGTTNAFLIHARLKSYQQREEVLLRAMKSLERHQRFVWHWRESIAAERQALPFVERVKDLFSGTSDLLARLWHFEIYLVEDTITTNDGTQVSGRRSVTVGKICLALLIFLVGYWLAGVISRIVEPVAVRRLGIDRNQAHVIRRWMRAVLIILLVLFSLKSVNIPLAVFAFAGGALAIGIGFGTQTLLKNFISGIILLFERPFRIGDVVDVQGQRGTVRSIGIRSCLVHLWDGTEQLIPNSALLENIVTNWTYSDRLVRFSIKVGVAYGSNAGLVADLLAMVAANHELVQKKPSPQVLLMEFGDNALHFELRYWLDVVQCSCPMVGSDLRRRILTSFAENHISIAFPQRDVHLDSLRPIQVQLLSADSESVPQQSSILR